MNDGIKRSAIFSPCKTWRYTLERVWKKSGQRMLFILLNPSTADAEHDDPTNRRGIAFAKREKCGSVVFVNLFAFRTPEPKQLKLANSPEGPDNNWYIKEQVKKAHIVVVAWGIHGNYRRRARAVRRLLKLHANLYCLGHTKDGHPKHILYLKKDAELIKWNPMPKS